YCSAAGNSNEKCDDQNLERQSTKWAKNFKRYTGPGGHVDPAICRSEDLFIQTSRRQACGDSVAANKWSAAVENLLDINFIYVAAKELSTRLTEDEKRLNDRIAALEKDLEIEIEYMNEVGTEGRPCIDCLTADVREPSTFEKIG